MNHPTPSCARLCRVILLMVVPLLLFGCSEASTEREGAEYRDLTPGIWTYLEESDPDQPDQDISSTKVDFAILEVEQINDREYRMVYGGGLARDQQMYRRRGTDGYYTLPDKDDPESEYLEMPLPVEPGTSWVSEMPEGAIEFEAEGIEACKVPAGTYQKCLKIIFDGEMRGRAVSGVRYYAPDVGMVKQVAQWPQGEIRLALVETTMGLASLRSRKTRGVAETNARGIHQAMFKYAQDNSGRMPGDIGTLLAENSITIERAISPTSGKEVPAEYEDWPEQEQMDWARKNGSFILVPDLTDDLDSDKVAVFMRPTDSDNADIVVVYNDNHVEWETDIDAVREKLREQTDMTMQQLISRQEGLVGSAPAPANTDSPPDVNDPGDRPLSLPGSN